MIFWGKTYDVSPYDSQRSHISINLMISWTSLSHLYKLLWNCQDCKFVWDKCTVRLAVTNHKNDRIDQHSVNPTLSISLTTPFPVATQGLDATAPREKNLLIPNLEFIVFTKLKTGIGRVLSKNYFHTSKSKWKRTPKSWIFTFLVVLHLNTPKLEKYWFRMIFLALGSLQKMPENRENSDFMEQNWHFEG